MNRTVTPLLLGTFRVLYQPSFHELEALQRLGLRYDGRRFSFWQWRSLLNAELLRGAALEVMA